MQMKAVCLPLWAANIPLSCRTASFVCSRWLPRRRRSEFDASCHYLIPVTSALLRSALPFLPKGDKSFCLTSCLCFVLTPTRKPVPGTVNRISHRLAQRPKGSDV